MPQVVRPTQALADIDFDDAPFLLGYVDDPPQADERSDPGDRKGRPAAGLVAVRPGHDRRVHLRRQEPLGRRVAHLARLQQVLGAGRPPRDAEERRQGRGRRRSISTGGRATVTLDAIDPSGRFLNQAETELTVIDPQLGSRKVQLTQTAPDVTWPVRREQERGLSPGADTEKERPGSLPPIARHQRRLQRRAAPEADE